MEGDWGQIPEESNTKEAKQRHQGSRGKQAGCVGGCCTQKPTEEPFTNKPVATGAIKSDYNVAELKGTSEETDR